MKKFYGCLPRQIHLQSIQLFFTEEFSLVSEYTKVFLGEETALAFPSHFGL